MDGSGLLSKQENACSSLLPPSPLEKIEQQITSSEFHSATPRLSDIWIHVEIAA
jgi:hypothetical protein